LPNAVKSGLSYYTLRLAFAQDRVPRATVKLIFAKTRPDWVRVYECVLNAEPRLVKSLSVVSAEQGPYEYIDEISDAPGQSARIYAFWRDCAAAPNYNLKREAQRGKNPLGIATVPKSATKPLQSTKNNNGHQMFDGR
jgi:hypothetical protein